MKFIVRLFPEISVKSKPVRTKLIRQVRQNLANACERHGIHVAAIAQWDKILADFGSPEAGQSEEELRQKAESELASLPGIHSFMEVREHEFQTLDDLYEKIKEECGPRIVGHTFAMRVRRRGQHNFTSQQAERILGGKLGSDYENRGVCLDDPEVTVNVEIENQKAYVTGERHEGMGGFPVGTQGEVFSLISGGFDSGVSTYLLMHRGCRVNFLFFNLGGTAHELGVKEEAYYLWDRYAASHKVRFVTVPFEKVVGQILERTHHGVRGVILKRMMMRAGELICRRFHAEALVTGESLGQVSSQTLTNLSHIDSVTPFLILRPLISMDKQQIIDAARRIGTAGFAERMPEYCGVISDHPNVCPRRSFVEEEEAKMDAGLIEEAAGSARAVDIRDVPEDIARIREEVTEVRSLAEGVCVIDVRAPDDQAKAPLNVPGHEVISMPFYKVAAQFGSLDMAKTYALYCDQGVMSTMQAKQLKEMGHHNVQVWRPSACAVKN
ncbi:MAG: tRNA uracil 4-sulfurtransferase ThiI [Succinivibrio sp.]|jgi:thiamine biosynthesis protein ThiI|nr:tRNA uracil 4-sulfurtransferase ThiI [Succinivibrio sp.]